jgi:hypothetical protein
MQLANKMAANGERKQLSVQHNIEPYETAINVMSSNTRWRNIRR